MLFVAFQVLSSFNVIIIITIKIIFIGRDLFREAVRRIMLTLEELQISTTPVGCALHKSGVYGGVTNRKLLLEESLKLATSHLDDYQNVGKNGPYSGETQRKLSDLLKNADTPSI
ncbi:hypothetical protein XENOCAPTIV_030205 [Xenoophorus captivus]|uniref:Uncharacterized protein n=1 Tax=Xenoophorus captivus TaxID=1517983 RepID=A0ABV0Q424_9TELE